MNFKFACIMLLLVRELGIGPSLEHFWLKLSHLETISVGFSEWKVDAARTTKATKLWDGNLWDTALPTNGANCDLQFESTTIDNSSKTFPLKR